MSSLPKANVQRKDVEGRLKAGGVENGHDVSTEKRSWKSYFWDSWDKSPEERWLILKVNICKLFLYVAVILFRRANQVLLLDGPNTHDLWLSRHFHQVSRQV